MRYTHTLFFFFYFSFLSCIEYDFMKQLRKCLQIDDSTRKLRLIWTSSVFFFLLMKSFFIFVAFDSNTNHLNFVHFSLMCFSFFQNPFRNLIYFSCSHRSTKCFSVWFVEYFIQQSLYQYCKCIAFLDFYYDIHIPRFYVYLLKENERKMTFFLKISIHFVSVSLLKPMCISSRVSYSIAYNNRIKADSLPFLLLWFLHSFYA